MSWYENAFFYHIYPLGLTGAPAENPGGAPEHRLRDLTPWLDHIRSLGCTGLYIGPLFESGSHGYDTTDYRQLDRRLGTNDDLRDFVRACHERSIRVILDAVFNHTGRGFFAFQDLKARREASPYRDWYCWVNFGGDNAFGDGFSYESWHGYDLLAKLNLKNPAVADYHLETVHGWIRDFDIDGLRLDVAEDLDFDFLRRLRAETAYRPDFWLMGEVMRGDYSRWVNPSMLHAVTNYPLHKALFSAHNDHNYFELAHTVKRQREQTGDTPLYNFADNHDVDRIASKLRDPAQLRPVYTLLFTLPGVPSIYYGSEFGLAGRRENGSDAPLRPCLDLEALTREPNAVLDLIKTLAALRNAVPDLQNGAYRELQLTTGQFAFARGNAVIAVNNTDAPVRFDVPAPADRPYRGALTGAQTAPDWGRLRFDLEPNGGEIWLPQA